MGVFVLPSLEHSASNCVEVSHYIQITELFLRGGAFKAQRLIGHEEAP
jgi:hypothetical protein